VILRAFRWYFRLLRRLGLGAAMFAASGLYVGLLYQTPGLARLIELQLRLWVNSH
jgi:hypothetical protein